MVKGAGGATAVQGGAGDFSGLIYSEGSIESITVTGDMVGGGGDQ